MATYQQVKDLIATNLAGDPKIAPDKHREVEYALLDYIQELKDITPTVLAKGTVYVGDVGGDKRIVCTIPQQASTNYNVLGSLKNVSGIWQRSNGCPWSWGEAGLTSFAVYIGETSNEPQDLEFTFMLVPK